MHFSTLVMSPLWSKLDPVLRKKLHVIREDGEFWMQLGDFVKRFNSLDICYLTADKLGEEVVPDSWNCSIYHSCWVKGFSAGGCWTFCNDGNRWPQRLEWVGSTAIYKCRSSGGMAHGRGVE
uniref:Uncharacterized protein n=1 Tax=Sphaerodactylus townsendi TaxID=933632 RepID=A0ACB8FTC2_9SAUR